MIALFLAILISNSECYFGYSELEFVGKVVSEKRLQTSRTKIQSIIDFQLPTVSKQLKSFLETANNFLQPSVSHCKNRKVVWTPESTAAFHEMKLAISKCTTMHFISDTAPITLHTYERYELCERRTTIEYYGT